MSNNNCHGYGSRPFMATKTRLIWLRGEIGVLGEGQPQIPYQGALWQYAVVHVANGMIAGRKLATLSKLQEYLLNRQNVLCLVDYLGNSFTLPFSIP